MNWEIHPGIGVGDLIYGVERAQVETILGIAEQINTSDLPSQKTIAWYYWSQGISAHFHEAENYRLSSLEIGNEAATLDGQPFVGLSREHLLTTVTREGWDAEIDEEEDCVMVKSLGLTFWIEDEEIDSIQCYPLLDANSDNIWPAQQTESPS